jgi:hypothetical protein
VTDRSALDRKIDDLLTAIVAKVQAHRVTVGASLNHGQVKWRYDPKSDQFEVTIQADV